ncbi:uncharacterized protein LOC142582421 isoform X2 [Dermacentor variabilis]|uniref:uncharacterized protein LOC142582421 isoform X2 n=1 Tax=Dermacentor variabilis TaxID=34621 RepID=UPI003F5B84EF
MKKASLSLLLFYVVCYGFGDENFVAARISKRSKQPLKKVLELFNKTESTKTKVLQPTVSPRIVTDMNLDGHRLAEIFEDTSSGEFVSCNLVGNKTLIENILKSIPSELVKDVSVEEMDQFIDKCADKDTTQERSSLLESLGDAFQSLVIFPGTKWCGAGDVAKNYDDLGSARDTDRCCREHDHSQDSIPAFQTKHNVTNYLPYTMGTGRGATPQDMLEVHIIRTHRAVRAWEPFGVHCVQRRKARDRVRLRQKVLQLSTKREQPPFRDCGSLVFRPAANEVLRVWLSH